MVTFFLEAKTNSMMIYRYYPEKHLDSTPGIITVHLADNSLTLDVIAAEDFYCRTSARELNEMRDTINSMRVENGEEPLTEAELPTAIDDDEWYYYADHVMCRIRDEISKGKVPEKGTVAWY